MKLHYLANLFATMHYIGSVLGLHSRQLLLNQAAAAKHVNDAIDQAMSSVKNGDVTGVALPLNFVLSSPNHQLTVSLRLPGVDQNQNMMIDTGMIDISSNISLFLYFEFCYHYHIICVSIFSNTPTVVNHDD